MQESSNYVQQLIDCSDLAEVGGKGANLGNLARAGFPVPPGFVLTTHAYRAAQKKISAITVPPVVNPIPPEVEQAILEAYRQLGAPPVAVRSSATAEDMAAASMAGQYETFLDVRGEEELLEKIRHCWASLDSPRTRAYLAEHSISRENVAMAVVVQALVPAEVAGVLFTLNPLTAAHDEMLVEASWGLGESVVSGRVQPDIFRLNAATGATISQSISDKKTMLVPRSAQENANLLIGGSSAHASSAVETEVPAPQRKAACLADPDLEKLWQLGKKAAAHFGAPQDIEWALAGGNLYLLQSRPITTHLDAQARADVLAAARQNLSGKTGPWALHNLAETLPHPTPLTWSVLRRFMSGDGGFGNMYRMAGFHPSVKVRADGFLDLIAGRIYMDASRAPEMFFENFPFAYDLHELKRSPDASQSPPTLPRGTFRERLRIGKRLSTVNENLRHRAQTFDKDMLKIHLPALKDYVAAARKIDLKALSTEDLLDLWEKHERRVMDDFAPLSLLPSLISAMALAELRAFLAEHLWEEDAAALTQTLSAGGVANRTLMADADLYELSRGTRGVQSWLDEHGHRGTGEFDLAASRWREKPATLIEMSSRLATGDSPLERHRHASEHAATRAAQIRARLAPQYGDDFDRRLELVRRYMPFREDGKDFLMLGYELLRQLACEMGRRLGIGEDVFYLTRPEMLAALRAGPADAALKALLEKRRRDYRAESKITLPRVIEGPAVFDAAAAIPGVTSPAAPHGTHKGFVISSGRATGKARILRSPSDPAAASLEKGYILVCPSTDPSWTPLFVNAAGLILEVGGTLSHGAVVAREMGLPALVIENATTLFTDGEEILLDAAAGIAGPLGTPLGIPASGGRPSIDPNDTVIPHNLLPPPEGPKDKRAAILRNRAAIAWTLFILAFFLLPAAWVYIPTIHLLDRFLWPIVRAAGKPWTVVIVAALIAVITLTLQKLLTDNPRLLAAKRRANLLQNEADRLPANSPRQLALRRAAAPVQGRLLLAALVPVGLLLGPMLLPFAWFKDRIEPSAWNSPPGTPVELVVYLDPAFSGTVTLDAPAPLNLDEKSTPKIQSALPLQPTLEKLLALYQSPNASDAWQLAYVPIKDPAAAAADLKSYLQQGPPPQVLRWQFNPADQTAGAFRLHLSAGKFFTGTTVILGDAHAPVSKTAAGIGPIQQLRLNYAPDSRPRIFWQPLAFLAPHPERKSPDLPAHAERKSPDVPSSNPTIAVRLAAWDIGWLWLYILAYLPILYLTRWLLQVA
jgi:pyruvate,water dikinase